jgi:hypothetical protein
MLSTILETDDAIDLGEESIVLAPADVRAGLKRCATLTDDDAAAEDGLSAENFDSEPLCV